MTRAPILFAAAPERGRALLGGWRGQRPGFCCVLAYTETCLIPGLSAAGVSESVRPLTPAADAEVVLLGAPRCLTSLPSNPRGAAGPAGITRAAVQLADLQAGFVGAGLPVWPAAPCRRLHPQPGGSIERAQAVPHARELFDIGDALGRELAAGAPYLVLAESVPGGTTTALALLLALGYRAEGRVSGSQRGNEHALKSLVAHSALRRAGLTPGAVRKDPLQAVAEVGDPMQPVAAAAALAAQATGRGVLLAGGSQMLAVAALMVALSGPDALANVAVGTTRWVVADPDADVAGLAAEISPGLAVLAANLNFSASRHRSLRPYEDFVVKEGVGAGGASIAALLATEAPVEMLEAAIDAVYDQALASASRTLQPR